MHMLTIEDIPTNKGTTEETTVSFQLYSILQYYTNF